MSAAKKFKKENTIMADDLDSLLAAVKKDIKKDFDFSKPTEAKELEFLSTGNCAVNYALSGKVDGGFPVGWLTELAGLNSTGKTLLALHGLVETQKNGGVAILIDSEFAFNPMWYKTLGGDPTTLIHFEPDYIEQAYQFIENTVESLRDKNATIPVTIVYDSIAASPSKMEFDGDMEKHDMGKRAIAHGKGVRMLMGLAKKKNVTFISINQYRKNIGVMYGPDMSTTGGMGWEYACSTRVHMKKGKIIKEKRAGGEVAVGIAGSLRVVKNRCRSPFAEAEFNIFFDRGIDPISGLFDVLTSEGVIDASGQGWWEYKGKKFQKGKFDEIIAEFPELLGGHKLMQIDNDKLIIEEATVESTDADM